MSMTIGEAARATSTTARAIRLYEQRGLLPATTRQSHNGYRTFAPEDLQRLHFIRRAQALGFSLADIAEMLALSHEDCQRVHDLAHQHLVTVEHRLAELRKLRTGLRTILNDCHRAPADDCPVLRALSAG